MLRIAALVAFIASSALAAPSENHWGSSGPDDPAYAKAAALVAEERYAEALPRLKALAAVEPENADVLNLLGFSHRKLGDLPASAQAYRAALRSEPNHRGALEYQGELFLTLGEIENALANLDRLERLCPSGCDERAALSAAVADWRAANGG